MATVKTYDLLKCNSSTQILPSVNNIGLDPFNGLIVKFDNDNKKSYKIRKNVQGRFLDGSVPTGPDEGYPSGLDIRWSVSSMKFNGTELMSATSNLRVSEADGLYTFFPNYTLGNEYLYTSNVANAVIVGDSPTDTGNKQNNFYRFIESIINYYGIPVKISKSPRLWWQDELFPSLNNIILEKYFDDNFEFTFIESYINLVDESFTSVKRRYVFNGATVEYYLNDVLVTVSPDLPQYNDEYSFFSYNFTYDSIVEVDVCPVFDPFKTSLSTDDCSNLSVNCDCSKISFSDNSNYGDNGLPGHDIDLFTSRTITITRPNGSKFILATDDISKRDVTIQAPGNSTNLFQYNIGSNDIDGIYSIQLCSYPDWDDSVLYDAYLQTIVRRNGILYKVIATNSNLDPELNLNYWQVYTCTDNCDDTRYCTTQKIVVLCVSLLKCYKKLVAEAFCSIESGICKDLCSNKKFQNAMKFRITLDQMEFSSCAGDWDAVKKQIDILNSICCCND
jgi:hypothetical protein